MDLVQSIKSAEKVDGIYFLERPYGKLAVSDEGLQIISSAEFRAEQILTSLFQREKEIAEDIAGEVSGTKQSHQDKSYLYQTGSLLPHLRGDYQFLGEGSEGSVFRMPVKDTHYALKFYSALSFNFESDGGLSQFSLMADAQQKDSVFQTPKPYFATDYLCAMQDFSMYPDYIKFVKKFPDEEDRLLSHIRRVAENDPVCPDLDLMSYYMAGIDIQDLSEDDSSATFITQFNPHEENDYKRYKLATADLRDPQEFPPQPL